MGEALTLEDVCLELVDCVNRTAPEAPDGLHFAIGTPAMRGNVLDLEQARRISSDVFASWTRRLTPVEGDLLLAREAPVGPVVRIPEGGIYAAGQRTTHLRANPSMVHPRFLFYLLISPNVQHRLIARAMGSTVPHLRVADVKSFELPTLPSLLEQEAVAQLLGALDDKVAANEEVIESCERLMVAIVSTVDTYTEVANLAGHSTIVVKPDEFDKTVAHFSLPAFDDGVIPEIAPATEIKSNKFVLARPCVLFSKLNPRIPRIWNVGSLPTEMAVASTEFVVLIPTGIDASVLWSALKQPDVSETIMRLVAGTSGSHQRIKPRELLDLPVRDVHKLADVQAQAIVNLGQICSERRRESAVLSGTRDELLPLLMSGKIRVKDAVAIASDVV